VPSDAIITQGELDSLLSSLETGAGEGGRRAGRRHGATAVHEARVHDFARGDALSRSMLQALESSYAGFAATAAAKLSGYLRARCRMALLSVDQLSYQQFKRSVPDPTVIGLLDLIHLPGEAVLELNQSVGLWIIDRMLGGAGEPPTLARALTEIEKALVSGALSILVSELSIALPGLPHAHATLLRVLHSAEAAEIAGPSEPVVVTSFEITLDDLIGMASICIPAGSLRGVADPQSASDAGESEVVSAALMHIRIPCAVRLGTVTMSAADVAGVAVGDVICLDRPPSGAMQFLVAGRPKFTCLPVPAGARSAADQRTAACRMAVARVGVGAYDE
jgi:flagellar motor switch protein FliM